MRGVLIGFAVAIAATYLGTGFITGKVKDEMKNQSRHARTVPQTQMDFEQMQSDMQKAREDMMRVQREMSENMMRAFDE